MDQFWEEFETGEIHFRDKWQFELRSEFIPIAGKKQSEYTQEFYIFIPSSLQINSETYSKKDFFRARTNLIRLLTPELTFKELLDPNNVNSPFRKLRLLQESIQKQASLMAMDQELKLFANIFRSTLIKAIYPLLEAIEASSTDEEISKCSQAIDQLLIDIKAVQIEFNNLRESTLKKPEGYILLHIFEYIRDVISIALNTGMATLLEAVRQKVNPLLQQADDELSNILLREKKFREDELKEPGELDKDAIKNEGILYQSSLLNKFILDALLLRTKRKAVDEKFRSLIGSFAAATAMLLYLLLFISQGTVFVINSLPFILFTVLIYVVKDRIKEELKNLSYRHVFKWFPDFTTEIYLPEGKEVIGKVHESFSFIEESEVPMDIFQLRNQEFHSYLEMIKRHEKVINYKKKVVIYENNHKPLQGLKFIFRMDIHDFLIKGSNPYEPYITLDRETLGLTRTLLPKVYHVNVIMKNRYLTSDLKEKIEYKKFRIVVDKEGIKRIEGVMGDSSNIQKS